MKKKSTELTVTQNIGDRPAVLFRLRSACTKAKEDVAERGTVTITLQNLYPALEYRIDLQKDDLVGLWEPFVIMSQTLVNEALKSASLKASDITECVFIGDLIILALKSSLIKMLHANCEVTLLGRESVVTAAAILDAKMVVLLACSQHAIGVELPNSFLLPVLPTSLCPSRLRYRSGSYPAQNNQKLCCKCTRGIEDRSTYLRNAKLMPPNPESRSFLP